MVINVKILSKEGNREQGTGNRDSKKKPTKGA
jgi:hypothetical protein